ncbi:ankyrin repeat-containing domain, PGG domain protein [Tanacetum coccineum]
MSLICGSFQNKSGNTALCLAAIAGNLETVDIMVNKNKTLLRIPGSEGMMPLYMASSFGHYDAVKYLFEKSNGLRDDDGWDAKNRAWLLQKCVEGDMFHIVWDVLYDICRRACVISAKKEAPVNYLTNPSDERSTLRPADVLVFGRFERKHACVDLTGVSPLVGLSSRGFTFIDIHVHLQDAGVGGGVSPTGKSEEPKNEKIPSASEPIKSDGGKLKNKIQNEEEMTSTALKIDLTLHDSSTINNLHGVCYMD